MINHCTQSENPNEVMQSFATSERHFTPIKTLEEHVKSCDLDEFVQSIFPFDYIAASWGGGLSLKLVIQTNGTLMTKKRIMENLLATPLDEEENQDNWVISTLGNKYEFGRLEFRRRHLIQIF